MLVFFAEYRALIPVLPCGYGLRFRNPKPERQKVKSCRFILVVLVIFIGQLFPSCGLLFQQLPPVGKPCKWVASAAQMPR